MENKMLCGYWEKYKGQELETTDLVWFRKGGFAYVSSSSSCLEPDGFTSIPEDWSFSDCNVNQKTFGINGVSHVRSNGWVYRDMDYGGDRIDKIEYICKIRKPNKNG